MGGLRQYVEKGAEKLRHGNQQRRKRGMGTTKTERQKGHGRRQQKRQKKKRRQVHLKTQHGRTGGEWVGERQRRDGNSGEKVGKSRDRWTISLGKKEKERQKARPDRHMRPAAQLKGGCVCTVENLGRKK